MDAVALWSGDKVRFFNDFFSIFSPFLLLLHFVYDFIINLLGYFIICNTAIIRKTKASTPHDIAPL